ncbi:fluoride efflux transporter CrcB [Paenibacillus methanolicus]|uniref:Fluoride-specific ion channel FluC n=1 Tax=Paenibacillus methanolicus TaxID=582686 RepID=A0A5S5C624_9BACL|nr:fluoride efflux transporter CrcB [Paenibacillus methanolicus]TYP74875.1 CrcB protein [Paenibacillus methanolicus]
MNGIALAAGGFAGTLLRYWLGEAIPTLGDGFSLGILIINLFGCFALGVLFAATPERWSTPPQIRLGLGTGVMGAFTTFSTFSVQSADLLRTGHAVTAGLYILLSVGGGLALSFAGSRLGRRPRRGQEEAAS